MTRALLLLLIPTAALPGCNDGASGWNFGPAQQSPAGRTFYFTDRGSAALHDVATLYDHAAEDAAVYLYKYGPDFNAVQAALASYKVAVEDHFLFATNASGTGFAAGSIHPPSRTLIVAFYSRQRNADGPPHTHHDWGGGNVHSGIIPRACPALGHELGHHFFGASFEHGWVPPIVNGRSLYTAAPNWDLDCPVR